MEVASTLSLTTSHGVALFISRQFSRRSCEEKRVAFMVTKEILAVFLIYKFTKRRERIQLREKEKNDVTISSYHCYSYFFPPRTLHFTISMNFSGMKITLLLVYLSPQSATTRVNSTRL